MPLGGLTSLQLSRISSPMENKALMAYIQTRIAKEGPISFSDYMHMALYAPGLGYYVTDTHKLGKGGDFITAPELSPLFGHCIARQAEEIFQQGISLNFLELGAGSGKMANDILDFLTQQNITIDHYYILEPSPDFQQRQAALLTPRWKNRVKWLTTLPPHFNGIIVANEVMDALPVKIFRQEDTLKERRVDYQKGQFCWKSEPAS